MDVIVNSVPSNLDLYQGPLSRGIMESLDKPDQTLVQQQAQTKGELKEGEMHATCGGSHWMAIYHTRLCAWDGGKGPATKVHCFTSNI